MHADLIILGGGLAGLALAAQLRTSSRRIVLIEPRPPTRQSPLDPRAYALSPAAVDGLNAAGVWPHVPREARTPILAMHIFGDAGGELTFTARDAGVACLAEMVEAGALVDELWQHVKRQANVTLITGQAPTALERDADAAAVTLGDGHRFTAQLVVGADGGDSWTRQAAGLNANAHAYGERGVVATFRAEMPHAGCAYQFFTAAGVLAWLPLPENRISIVWSAPQALADELVALSPEQLANRVADAGGGRLGRLAPLGAATAFPLRLIQVPLTAAARVALIGDAAHGIHPLSGHGINLGFADARALAELVGNASPHRDIGEPRLLRAYQRARKEETVALQTGTDLLHTVFSTPHPLLGNLRNRGLGWVDQLPWLKSTLARYAMG